MRKLLWFSMISIALMLTGCETTSDDFDCTTDCNEYSECSLDNTTCVVKDGRCLNDADCSDDGDKSSCNLTNHTCEMPTETCTEGATRCNSDNSAFETCAANIWTATTCETDTVCSVDNNVAACKAVVETCTEGATRCNSDNSAFETCAANIWTATTCETDTVCSVDNNVAACKAVAVVCTEGAMQCSLDAMSVETCTNNAWVATACNTGDSCKVEGDVTACVSETGCTGLSVDNIGVGTATNKYMGTDGDTTVRIEFYAASGAASYDLASTINSSYKTCEQCVLAELGEKKFFQESGSLTITAGDGFMYSESAGSLTTVKLVESIINIADNTTEPVEGGACLEIETASWDTLCVKDTMRCTTDEKSQVCGDNGVWTLVKDCAAMSNICNPETYACEAPGCEEDDQRCTADGELQLCDAAGEWQLDEDCDAADKVCNDATYTCDTPSTCVISDNSSYDTAIALTMGEYTESICATETIDNGDWFSVTVPAGDTLIVTVDPGAVALDLFYTDGSSEGTFSSNEGVLTYLNESDASEDFLIKAYMFGAHADTDYTMIASVSYVCVASENNTAATATEMTLAQVNMGTLCSTEDVDWYSVEVGAGEKVVINVTGDVYYEMYDDAEGTNQITYDIEGVIGYTNNGSEPITYLLKVYYGMGDTHGDTEYSFTPNIELKK